MHPQTHMNQEPNDQVVVYTRAGCHLCEEADRLLREHGWRPTLIDIDNPDNAALRERFDHCVPVVEIDGVVRFRGRVDPILLRRLRRS